MKLNGYTLGFAAFISAIGGAAVGYFATNNSSSDENYRFKWGMTTTETTWESEDGNSIDVPVSDQTWYIDSKESKIRIESEVSADSEVIFVQEYIDGLLYEYYTIDKQKYGNWVNDENKKSQFCTAYNYDTGAECNDEFEKYSGALQSIKEDSEKMHCKIHRNTHIKEVFRPSAKGNKSNTAQIGDLRVSDDGKAFVNYEGEIIGTITSVFESWDDDDLITGCVEEEVSDDDDENSRRNLRASNNDTPIHPRNDRDLLAFSFGDDLQDFFQTQSHTLWCGPGTDRNTTCPGDHSTTPQNYDQNADAACRLHDHAKRSQTVWGGSAVRSSCDVDNDLNVNTPNNLAVQMTFGKYGVASTWGCIDRDLVSSWHWCKKRSGWWWSYWAICHTREWREVTKFGPSRYNDIKNVFGYKKGQFVKDWNDCQTDTNYSPTFS